MPSRRWVAEPENRLAPPRGALQDGENHFFVNRLKVACAEVGKEDIGAERGARGGRHELRSGDARALAVHVGPEPGEERRELALGDSWHDRWVRALRGGEELRRRHRAQRVGREIAPCTAVPVHVLETSQPV